MIRYKLRGDKEFGQGFKEDNLVLLKTLSGGIAYSGLYLDCRYQNGRVSRPAHDCPE